MKHLIPNYIRQQYAQENTHGYFQAFTMFIDLSGFTPMTETLMKQGSEGAEQLSVILNDIFAPMVNLVYERGGFIPYFAGDAFTAVFPKNELITPTEFIGTAQLIRQLFPNKQIWETRFGSFKIGIKIGLSSGEVQWGIVGEQYCSFYFRGKAIDACADAEKLAKGQDVILDATTAYFVKDNDILEPIGEGFFKLIKEVPVKKVLREIDNHITFTETDYQHFLPKSIIYFDQKGEFRDVISVFVSFKGIHTHELLNQFATTVLNQFNNFSGYLKEIDFGDKGCVMVGFFGAPVSFENNVDRALETLQAINKELASLRQTTGFEYRTGITTGTAYTGLVGGKERAQYAVVGNRVNLAARLMTYSDWGTVLVDKEIQKNRHFSFSHKGDIHYKGIEGLIPTYILEGRSDAGTIFFTGEMVGREAELDKLIQLTQPLFKHQFAGIAYVYGEAGIGKSRLSFELKNHLAANRAISWFTCPADQILRKPFNPFIYFLKAYFEIIPDDSPHNNKLKFIERFEELLKQLQNSQHPESEVLNKELRRTRSVLAAQLNIPFSGSLWKQLDAKGRFQNTLDAIITLLKTEALLKPVVLELEDGHWYDDSSKLLLAEFIKKTANLPFFLLITSRYKDDGAKPILIPPELLAKHKISTEEIDLNNLTNAGLKSFASAKLQGEIHKDFLELLQRSTNGNPFYVEQIIEYFAESNLLKEVDGQWYIKDKNIKISSSINAILMARVDRLSGLVKETVKAAAVIGREFELPVLNEVMKAQPTFIAQNGNMQNVLNEQIQTAERGQIWRALNELRYIFKHSLLREAVYSMQLGTQLRELHQLIAEAIEKLYTGNLDQKYVDLAFHYEQAEIEDKTNEYLKKAADYARQNFQNKGAINFYEKLVKNLRKNGHQTALIKALLDKGNVQRLIGEWNACEATLQEAIEAAEILEDVLLVGRSNNSLGHLLMLKGNYTKAKSHLEKAAICFKDKKDEIGIIKVFGNLGNLYFRQGKYEDAKKHFIKSIQLAQAHPNAASNAQIVANLGLTYMNQGVYDEGIRWMKKQLQVCEKKQDYPGMATLYTNLGIVLFEKGDYDDALVFYEKGLALCEELGNKQLTAIAIGCIGSVYQRKGNYDKAMELFEKDLVLCEELGDKQGTAITLGLVGELCSIKGEFERAIPNLEQNLVLCQELKYQKGIAKALSALGDIYFYKNEYEKSFEYYDQAIEVTRKINNRLVLGSSLIDKTQPLLALNKINEVQQISDEAIQLAEELGNPDLLFRASILKAKLLHLQKETNNAIDILYDLLIQPIDRTEKAAVYYELYLILPDNFSHKQKAIELYQLLYKDTPQYLFKIRLEKLA